MIEKTLDELKERILEEAEYVDIRPYSHNIISLYLREIDKRFGKKITNEIIEECELEILGWHKWTGKVK
jgi:hypothetical protein